jgi:hypothetical protein
METVKNGFSGTLVSEMNLYEFVKAFHELPNMPRTKIRASVEKFDSKHFTQSMVQILSQKLELD